MPLTPQQARELIEVHQPELYRLAYSLLRSAPAAEKLSDGILLQGLAQAEKGGQTGQQLARRVVTACAWQHTLAGAKSRLGDALAALRAAGSNDGPAEAGAAYSAPGLWPAYQTLPPAQQRAVALRYFHNYPLETCAYLLSAGPAQVAQQLAEARHRLDSAAGGPHGMLGNYTPGLNHTQARQLLQSAVEQPVKGQPWMALQTHLEGCPACRAYRQRLDVLQRELGRALAPYLTPPQPAGPEAAARLLEFWGQSRGKR